MKTQSSQKNRARPAATIPMNNLKASLRTKPLTATAEWIDTTVAERKGPIRFRTITTGASVVSAILWACAAFVTPEPGGYGMFAVIGVLAVIAQVIAINSARKEHQEESA